MVCRWAAANGRTRASSSGIGPHLIAVGYDVEGPGERAATDEGRQAQDGVLEI